MPGNVELKLVPDERKRFKVSAVTRIQSEFEKAFLRGKTSHRINAHPQLTVFRGENIEFVKFLDRECVVYEPDKNRVTAVSPGAMWLWMDCTHLPSLSGTGYRCPVTEESREGMWARNYAEEIIGAVSGLAGVCDVRIVSQRIQVLERGSQRVFTQEGFLKQVTEDMGLDSIGFSLSDGHMNIYPFNAPFPCFKHDKFRVKQVYERGKEGVIRELKDRGILAERKIGEYIGKYDLCRQALIKAGYSVRKEMTAFRGEFGNLTPQPVINMSGRFRQTVSS